MKRSEFIGEFDLDAVLTELSVDLDIRVTRRMLAGACIGSNPEDAYLSRASCGNRSNGSTRARTRARSS